MFTPTDIQTLTCTRRGLDVCVVSRAAKHRRLLTAVAVGSLLLICTLAFAVSAQANQLTVFSCHTPAGKQVGVEGWQVFTTGQEYMFAKDTCAAEGHGMIGMELAASGYGYPNGAGIGWTFTAPAWATIARYTIEVAGSDTYQSEAGIDGQAAIYASDEGGGNYDYRNLDDGLLGAHTVARTPPDAVHWITAGASCDGEGGPCPTGQMIARLNISAATIVLDESSTPTVSSLAGRLISSEPLRGSAEASFNATDEGPGVYSAQLIVDGKAQPVVLLDSNNGLCENLGETSDGTRSFSSATPCAKSTSGSVTLNTASLADGTHTIKLIVDDAAGDQTTAFDTTISTNNAPESSKTLQILTPGTPTVGAALSSRPGEWSAPEDAGSISYTYQWQDCNSTGGQCAAISGASSAGYTPAPSDVGHTLRLTVTAADKDGTSSETSPATPVVGAAAGSLGAQPGPGANPTTPASSRTPAASKPSAAASTASAAATAAKAAARAVLRLGIHHRIIRSFAHRAIKHLKGRLLQASGHPIGHARLLVLERTGPHGKLRVIGHARTGAHGAFRADVPGGPSRLIEVAYRAGQHEAGFAAVAKLHETVRAGVRLQISPRATTSTGTILLKGRVLGRIPRHGVQVDLFVHYRGKWEPFRTVRSDGEGRFTVAYQFQGATGRFPFRAEVISGQSRFPFATGKSEVINVASR